MDFIADEPGRWTADLHAVHDQPLAYAAGPFTNNTGTVMGTLGQYEFYVVELESPRLSVAEPGPGFVTLIGEEVFVTSDGGTSHALFLPLILRNH